MPRRPTPFKIQYERGDAHAKMMSAVLVADRSLFLLAEIRAATQTATKMTRRTPITMCSVMEYFSSVFFSLDMFVKRYRSSILVSVVYLADTFFFSTCLKIHLSDFERGEKSSSTGMIQYKFSSSRSARTKSVDFGLLSEDEIRLMSVVEVSNVNIYHRGIPQSNGCLDIRMGTVDRRMLCGTCCGDTCSCPGHFGHIELHVPLYSVVYLDHTLRVLRSVCYFCSSLLVQVDGENCQGDRKQTFLSVYACCKTKRKCPVCSGPQPLYARVGAGIKIDWSDATTGWESEEEKEEVTGRRTFTSVEAASILDHISEEDVERMGLCPKRSHPRNTVMDVLPCLPVVARPAIMTSTGSRSRGQDDLTNIYQSIVKKAIDLKAHIEKTGWRRDEPIGQDMADKMGKVQAEVFALVNNNARGQKQSTQRSGAPIKSIVCRLKGKEGRIRGNLMGKRVNFSSRSVITPDSMQGVEEIGVPRRLAYELTIPERVTSSNIEQLRRRVLIGPQSAEGASSVMEKDDGPVTHLDACQDRRRIHVSVGDTVERPIQDGDWVIFNRQPSLHKFSMMAHRVKLVDGLTFRINLCTAAPYNADFDGDEMNMHVVQSRAAQMEVKYLMGVPLQASTPAASRPVMGIVQDTLVGSYILSSPLLLTRKQVYRAFGFEMGSLPPPAVACPVERWTGSQLISTLLPPTLSLEKGDVLIRGGVLLRGRLTKSVLGTQPGGLIDVMTKEYGCHETMRFMTRLQRLVNAVLMDVGFSVSISDCLISEEGHAKIRDSIEEVIDNCNSISSSDFPETLSVKAESTTVRMLSKVLMNCGSLARSHVRAENAIFDMVNCGSKGNLINCSQVSACVGQQSVEGKRIFSSSTGRTLSCFEKEEKSTAAQGFVSNSFALGLNPVEFFFHAMGGREGLVDTAVKTAVTGYIQRRLIKLLEDFSICYRGTVRGSRGKVMDFLFGGDGCDASLLERVDLHAITRETEGVFGREEECIRSLQRHVRQCRLSPNEPDLDVHCVIPFHPERVVQSLAGTGPWSEPDAPFDRESALDFLDRLQEEKEFRTCKTAALALRHHMRTDVLREKNISLPLLKETVLTKMREASIEAGEQVGIQAAQSLGEYVTQMTLNSFHYSGVASKSTALGIPRFKEILDATKKCRTPSNTLYLKRPFCYSERFATHFASTLSCSKLSTFIQRMEFVSSSSLEEWLDPFRTLPASGTYCKMTLLKNELLQRNLCPSTLARILRSRTGHMMHVLSSPSTSLEWSLYIRLHHVREMSDNAPCSQSIEQTLTSRVIAMLMDQVVLFGHPDIVSAHPRKASVWTGVEHEDVYVIDTIGTFLGTVSSFSNVVDVEGCISNDLHEMLDTLGVEACTLSCFYEILNVITHDGSFVNRRHVELVSLAMTRDGFLSAISRHGLNRTGTKIGPLMRCSFEETTDVLTEAAMYAESDDASGVTSSVMNGEKAKIGTGCFDVLVPSKALEEEDERGRRRAKRSTLAKSRLRYKSSDREKKRLTRDRIEFVNQSLWTFRGSTAEEEEECDVPFLAKQQGQSLADSGREEARDCETSCFYASHMKREEEECVRRRRFVPRSP